MKRKLFSVILLCLGVILMFTACNNSDPAPSVTTEATTVTTTVTTNPEEEPAPELSYTLKINGTDISSFRIVYAAVPAAEAKAYEDYQRFIKGQDTEFDRLNAEHLAKVIEAWCGVCPEVVKDSESEATENEILVGKTNRTQSAMSGTQDARAFMLRLVENKLVICGGSYGATWHAINALEAHLDGAMPAQNSSEVIVDLTSDADLSGRAALKNVACLGDSITYGLKSADPNYLSWTAHVQRTLWRDCLVYNYGSSGRTMRSDEDVKTADGQLVPYMNSDPYRNFTAFGDTFDIVLIMLGTNDAGLDPVWDDADAERYMTDAHLLVGAVKEKHPNAEVVIMNCPPRYMAEIENFTLVRELQLRHAKEIAEKYGSSYHYDMGAYCNDHIRFTLFPDLLHPDNEGYKLMGVGVSDLLRTVLEGTENSYVTAFEGTTATP